jgi:hypothetical protein
MPAMPPSPPTAPPAAPPVSHDAATQAISPSTGFADADRTATVMHTPPTPTTPSPSARSSRAQWDERMQRFREGTAQHDHIPRPADAPPPAAPPRTPTPAAVPPAPRGLQRRRCRNQSRRPRDRRK